MRALPSWIDPRVDDDRPPGPVPVPGRETSSAHLLSSRLARPSQRGGTRHALSSARGTLLFIAFLAPLLLAPPASHAASATLQSVQRRVEVTGTTRIPVFYNFNGTALQTQYNALLATGTDLQIASSDFHHTALCLAEDVCSWDLPSGTATATEFEVDTLPGLFDASVDVVRGANGQASQYSSADRDRMTFTGAMSCAPPMDLVPTQLSPDYERNGTCAAQLEFEVTFSVITPTPYTLTAVFEMIQAHGTGPTPFFTVDPLLVLSQQGGPDVLSVSYADCQNFTIPPSGPTVVISCPPTSQFLSGVLTPGTYTLRFFESGSIFGSSTQPKSGGSGSGDYAFTLNLNQAVPVTGLVGRGLLLAGIVCTLPLLRRLRRRG